MHVPILWRPYYLYNPITGESICIPQVKIANCKNMNSGFGYCIRTNKFKLMRILNYQPQLVDSELVVEILTLGTGLWRLEKNRICTDQFLYSRYPIKWFSCSWCLLVLFGRIDSLVNV